MKLKDIVVEKAILTELHARERDDVIAELIDGLVASGAAAAEDRDALLERLLDRERKGSTGFGRGVAVPHVKHPGVNRLSAAVGLSASGVEFQSLDRQPVYSVFLLLSPEDKPEEHLQAMEAIFKRLSKDTFRRALRQASSTDEVMALLDDADQPALGG